MNIPETCPYCEAKRDRDPLANYIRYTCESELLQLAENPDDGMYRSNYCRERQSHQQTRIQLQQLLSSVEGALDVIKA